MIPSTQSLTLWESGDSPSGSRSPLWTLENAAGTSAVFNFDGTAVHSALLIGCQYLWAMAATVLEDNRVTDTRVLISSTAKAEYRFALYEDRGSNPTLPGTMIYVTNPGNQTDIRSSQFYSTEAGTPSWFGPVGAVYADLSPDGSEAIYSQDSPQLERYLWVQSTDLSLPPTPLGITGFDARWSPDGTEIVFARSRTDYSSVLNLTAANIHVANADGTNDVQLDPERDVYQRFCVWSADGEWIAYRHTAADGLTLWLIHPDGSQNHAVVFTGVEGYPGYQVDMFTEQSWAPEYGPAGGSLRRGERQRRRYQRVGVVSRDGGLLKPILLTPPEVQCCADVHIPYWGPDGTHIVFSAALEDTPSPSWGTQQLVKDVELWMINADGSGNPVRLTNDHVFESYLSWWAPEVFTDVHKGNWAYCAINACQQADSGPWLPGRKLRPHPVRYPRSDGRVHLSCAGPRR